MLPMLTLSALSQWYLPRLGLRLVVFTGLLLIAAGFFSMRVLEVHSPYWDMAWPLLVMSTGIGFCTAPSTSAIMAAVPDEKQGVASAVNDTTREVGAALGIALAGSILAAWYGHIVAPLVAGFPESIREPASHSLAQALQISERLGPQGSPLAEISRTAFQQAMESSFLVLAIIIAIAALVIGAWAPGRDVRHYGSSERYWTNSAARCASITMVACGPRLVIAGRIEPSTTQRRSIPFTRQRWSTTAAASC